MTATTEKVGVHGDRKTYHMTFIPVFTCQNDFTCPKLASRIINLISKNDDNKSIVITCG